MTAESGQLVGLGLVLAIFVLQFLVLVAVAVFDHRLNRRTRRLQVRSAALLASLDDRAVDHELAGHLSRKERLRLASVLAVEIALWRPGRDRSDHAHGKLDTFRREVLEDLAWIVAALQQRRWRLRRRFLRISFLRGLDLVEELPSGDNLPLLITALDLDDEAIRARTAILLAREPMIYSPTLILLAGALRDCSPLCLPSIYFGFEKLALAHPGRLPLLWPDPSPRVRRAVVGAAGKALAGSSNAIGRSELGSQLLELIDSATHDADAGVRQVACEALAGSRVPGTLGVLTGGLDDEVLEVRIAAVRALGAHQDPRAVESLFDHLERASSPLSREILKALARMATPGIRYVVSELTATQPKRQVAALRALGVMGGTDEAFEIARFLDNPNPHIRLEAALALATVARSPDLPLRGTVMVENLCVRLEEEEDDLVAGALVEAIASSGDVRSAGALMGRIGRSSSVLRERLVEGLAFLDHLVYRGSRALDRA